MEKLKEGNWVMQSSTPPYITIAKMKFVFIKFWPHPPFLLQASLRHKTLFSTIILDINKNDMICIDKDKLEKQLLVTSRFH